MGRVVFKTVESDIDAGTHDERLYDKALHPWRSKLRRWVTPLVRAETPYIAKLQVNNHYILLSVHYSVKHSSNNK